MQYQNDKKHTLMENDNHTNNQGENNLPETGNSYAIFYRAREAAGGLSYLMLNPSLSNGATEIWTSSNADTEINSPK